MTEPTPNLRRARDPCIPGLIPAAYTKGSRHAAPVPVLKTNEIDDQTGHCNFEFEAQGSLGFYAIRAIGKLVMDVDDRGTPVGAGLKVTCSCPDGQRQPAAALSENNIIVCKHGAAALESVLDLEAIARYESNRSRMLQQAREEAARRREREERAKEEQDREIPGERSRIEYGLDAFTESEIEKHLKEACKTVDGLRALATVFPAFVMPVPRPQFCVRCKENYDDRYQDQTICRMRHPDEFCTEMWDTSKISWQHCNRCDGDFDVPDFYRKVSDDGEWCFVGKHT